MKLIVRLASLCASLSELYYKGLQWFLTQPTDAYSENFSKTFTLL